MEKKQHYRLNVEKQRSSPERLRFNSGFGGVEEEKKPNYYRMAKKLYEDLNNFISDRDTRERKRSLKDLIHINYIEIEFQDQFEFKYHNKWKEVFGISLVCLKKFNRVGLFSIVAQDKHIFENFLIQIENFVKQHYSKKKFTENEEYSNYIIYIRSFKLLTTEDILSAIDIPTDISSKQTYFPFLTLNLAELDADNAVEKNGIISSLLIFLNTLNVDQAQSKYIFDSLFSFLDIKGIEVDYYEDLDIIELKKIPREILLEIVNNFDIIRSVTNSFTIISPSTFNLKQASYGFSVSDASDDLPIIGIIDTGISQDSPLKKITIQDESFTLKDNPLVDSIGDYSEGHGTAVGALAAFGKKPYIQGYKGEISADAKLLSIKVFDENQTYISTESIINILKKVVKKYPNIKLFTLTIGYYTHKSTNEEFSFYTYELDKFSHENDCLIFIAAGNTNIMDNMPLEYNLNFFDIDETNLCTPADSLNNITIGAIADNISDKFTGIAINKNYPPLYSRTSHINLSELFSRVKQNRHYKKPDVLASGGDFEMSSSGGFIGQGDIASMQVLSANPQESFYKQVGTSFSTPLIANIAAKIQAKYPNIRTQTIKALILNSANNADIATEDRKTLHRVIGNGIVDEDLCLSSTDSDVSFIIEDEIENEKIMTYPINFPSYLTKEELGKINGIIKLEATLCFSFLPIKNNHLSYCPVNIAFGFFRNHQIDDILAPKSKANSILKPKANWSQQGHQVSKPIPYSNTQKISFSINKSELLQEGNTLQLAVRCRLSKQISVADTTLYPQKYNFSIAIRLEENFQGEMRGNLYDELALNNYLEPIIELDASSDLDLDINQ